MPNAYVVATEEVPGSTFDGQDVVLLVRNVKPYVPAATNAVLKVVNPDPTPFEDQVAFSRIQTTADANQKVADTGKVRISNTGTEPMQVTGLNLTDTFALESPPTLPFTLAPGASRDVTIRFTATSTKVHNGTLTVQSNAGNGSQTIQLGGLWQSLSENNQEPSVVQIARAFGIGTNIPTNLNANGHVEAVGDEILSPYWFRRDTTQPVTVRQLSGYHTYPNGATIRRFNKGTDGHDHVTEHEQPVGAVAAAAEERLDHAAGARVVDAGEHDHGVRLPGRRRVERPDQEQPHRRRRPTAASSPVATTSGSSRSRTATASRSRAPTC